MSVKRIVLPAVCLLGLAASLSAAVPYRVLNGPRDFYFGHISLTDARGDGLDPVVLRDGSKAPEPAILNLPLGPGDTVRTSMERRVEIQFDNGTIVRLDKDSELKIETILAQSLTSASQMSNLVLSRGRLYIQYKQYGNRELFQVLTAKAAVKPKHQSVAVIGLTPAGGTEVQMLYGKATVLYGADLKTPKSLLVEPKEGATFGADNRFTLGPPLPAGAFEAWNKSVNADFDKLHRGVTPLPKPVQRLQPAVFEWAQRFSNHYGEWLYDDYFGYVWRPFYNDLYPWGTWQPYYVGRWTNYRNSHFWIASEPWGWIPYHLGVWQWSSKRGWYWVPGSAFAPAWVDWTFFYGYWSWRPWSMWDWGMWYYNPLAWMGDYDYIAWGYPYWAWREPRPGSVERGVGRGPGWAWSLPNRPLYPLPSGYRSGLKRLMADLKKGDPAARESFFSQGKFASVVDRAGLTSPDLSRKAVSFESFRASAASRPSGDPVRILMSVQPPSKAWQEADQAMARLAAEAGDVAPGLGGRMDRGQDAAPRPAVERPRTGATASPRRTGGTVRTINWNPDARMAIRNRVTLAYDSRSNQILCPELGLTSGNSPYNRTEPGIYSGGSRPSAGGGGSSQGGPAGPSGSAGSASTASGSGSSTGSAGSGGPGGHIKK